MKKRLLIIGLVLALAMTAVMPAPVMAAPGKPGHAAEPFKADGDAAVVGAGTITSQKMLGNNIIIIKRTGEIIAGNIMSSDNWPEFAGAQFQITEDATTSLNLQNNKFTSFATGTVAVLQDGVPVMTGRYDAVMHGQFTVDSSNAIPFVFEYVIDRGVIDLKGIPRTAFTGQEVKGMVFASLKPGLTPGGLCMEYPVPGSGFWVPVPAGFPTLVGPITIKGKHS